MTWRHQLKTEPTRVATEGRFHALTCILGTVRVGTERHEPIILVKGRNRFDPGLPTRLCHAGDGNDIALVPKDPASVLSAMRGRLQQDKALTRRLWQCAVKQIPKICSGISYFQLESKLGSACRANVSIHGIIPWPPEQ